ncbi:MAG: 23S rRNA (uracil(1939)-C(5))-methyltransferase RlmD [Coriobacteriales bacterium]
MGYKTYTCPHVARCGGCEWLSVPYPIQLSRKRAMLEELFEPLGHGVDAVVGMDDPVAYRHKIMTPFAPGKEGKPRFGMYERGTHELVEARDCLVEHKAGRPILNSIAELAQGFHIPAYDENTGKGLLRHAIVRVGRSTGQVMVTLVVNRKEFPRKKVFVTALRKRHPSIASVSFNVNTRRTNAVLGPLSMTAYGQGWIEDELCGCTFRIPADAFYQTNPTQTELLYQTAVRMARLREEDRVLDAYCGIGTIGIIAAKQTRIELVGVESVESAVQIAAENAHINRVKNASFVCADAGEYLAKSEGMFDVVILDPPRAGASEEFLASVLSAAPRRIVYVSCNPATQVRDIERLAPAYQVKRLVGVDMFPHTKHLESVALLVRQ